MRMLGRWMCLCSMSLILLLIRLGLGGLGKLGLLAWWRLLGMRFITLPACGSGICLLRLIRWLWFDFFLPLCAGLGGGVCFGLRASVCWPLLLLASAVWLCDGIRDLLARFTRRPCAGRHLLFFAAAKKSRQKKAAHTANS